jgi:YD repeat-containing protein
LLGTAAQAGETISYSYDELGRLTTVARTGTVNAGTTGCYTYDKASNRSNVTVLTASDCAKPSFSINDVSVSEGGNLTFTVSKSGAASATYTLNYAIAAGTATQGSDYDLSCQAQTGTLTFGPTTATQTVCVHTIDDAAAEYAETVLVNLSSASGGATISDTQGVGTINLSDAPASCGVSFAASDADAGEGFPLVFTITKTGLTSSNCSVNYATADGTAVAPTHYGATSGTLTFGSTEFSKTVTVTTTDNGIPNTPRTMYLNLSSPTSPATLSDPQGAGSIDDDDGTGLNSADPPPDETTTPPDSADSTGSTPPSGGME